MKKLLTMALLCAVACPLKAQDTFLWINSGNIGIGTSSPATVLHVSGSSALLAPQRLTVPITPNGQGISLRNYDSLPAGQFTFIGLAKSDSIFNSGNLGATDNDAVGMAVVHTSASARNGAEISFVTHNNGLGSRERIRIDRFGNSAIGTTDALGYKLAANGHAMAEQMMVMLHTNWPDYVFSKTYAPKPLPELQNYIDRNHHLPDLPSVGQMEKEGLILGEMNKMLVKKVEGLTLYLIEQNKLTELLEEKL